MNRYSLIFFSLIFCMPASATTCKEFRTLAYNLQLDRQNGIYHKQDHSTMMLSDMYNEVWQRPARQDKEKAARKFADDWFYACEKKLYN